MDAETVTAFNRGGIRAHVVDFVESRPLNTALRPEDLHGCLHAVQLLNYVVRLANFHMASSCLTEPPAGQRPVSYIGLDKGHASMTAHVQRVMATPGDDDDAELSKSLFSLANMSRSRTSHTPR